MSVQVVVTTTATKYIAVYVTTIHLYVRLTRTIDVLQFIIGTTFFLLHITTSNSRYLTATEDAVTNVSTIDGHNGLINGTVVDISTTKHTSSFLQERIGRSFRVVLNLLLEALVKVRGLFVVATTCIILVAHITIVHGQVDSTKYGTTLTATIGIALNSR